MKETYEPIEMTVEIIPETDVITASIATTSEHDNAFGMFSLFE